MFHHIVATVSLAELLITCIAGFLILCYATHRSLTAVVVGLPTLYLTAVWLPRHVTNYVALTPAEDLYLFIYVLLAVSFPIFIWMLYTTNIRTRYFAYQKHVELEVYNEARLSEQNIHWLNWRKGRMVLSESGRDEFYRRIANLIDVEKYPARWWHHLPALILLGLCWPITMLHLAFSRDSHRMLRQFFSDPADRNLPVVAAPARPDETKTARNVVHIKRDEQQTLTYVTPISLDRIDS